MKKLNIYFTAGIPALNDTAAVMRCVQDAGADMMEIGIPYSDPVADGKVIQQADEIALRNGMHISLLFEQIRSVKDEINIPVILMGYLNPVMRFGIEEFCAKAKDAGVSGLILPDLPPYEFEKKYRKIFENYGINFSFLITPETDDERILYLDRLSSGFLYAVSHSSTTGGDQWIANEAYLKKIGTMNLKNPVFVGFGIKDHTDFNAATNYVSGGIIGSAFVKILLEETDWKSKGLQFIREIKTS